MAALDVLLSGQAVGTIDGFHYRVVFSSSVIESGKTRVSWDIYGDYTGWNTSSWAMGELVLNFSAYNGGTISSVTGNTIEWQQIYFENEPLLGSGSCIVNHDSSGKGGFTVFLDGNIGGYKDSFIDTTASYTLGKNMPYTACGAPTSITASGIIVPKGSFTISWSGATAGNNNPIKGYDIYYYVTSAGTAPTTSTKTGVVSVTSTSKSGSKVIDLSNVSIASNRGYKIVCGIVTKGTVSGYDSKIKTGGLITINSLPSAPSVSVDKNIVPSAGGFVNFTVDAGSDNDSSQSKSVYWSTDPSGDKTKISSSKSIKVTDTTTYYFWTYDGLEYSSTYSSKQIVKNIKPSFQAIISGQNLISVNNNSGYNYTVSPTVTLSSVIGGQPNKKFTYILHYGNDTSTTSIKVLYSEDTAIQKTISDVRSLDIGHELNGAYYCISVYCDDGIERSDEVYTDIRYVTKTPRLIGLYNKINFENAVGFFSGNMATYYSKFLGFQFEKDSGYNALKFNNHGGISQNIILSTDTNTTGSWTTTEEISSSITYNLSYQLGHSSGYMAVAVPQNITKIAKITLSNFKFGLGNQTYKFFTDTSTYSNTVGHSFFVSPLISGAIKDYGINSVLNSSHLFAKIYTNNLWSDSINFSLSSSVTNDNTIGFNLTSTSIADAISSLFMSDQKNSSYNATIRLYIKNDFDDESYIDSSFFVDFRENDNINLTLKRIYPEGNEHTLEKWEYLKEGMGNLIGEFNILSYNTTPKGEVQILRSTETSWQTLKNFNFDFSSSNTTSTATPGHPIIYSASEVIVQTIGEISNSNYVVSYRLIVTTDAGSQTFSLYNDIPARGHTSAVLVIQNNSYDGTNLAIGYTITNFGAEITNLKLGNNNKISLYLNEENTAKSVYIDNSSNYFSNSTKNAVFVYNFSNSESSLAKLGITTTLSTYLKSDTKKTEYFQTTKTSNLSSIEPVVIFNILPTVAYRKNHLGINILEPTTDDNPNAIIVIGEAPGLEGNVRDTIFFQSANNNTCKVINFLIDCGEW